MTMLRMILDHIDLLIAGLVGFFIGGFFGVLTMALMVGAKQYREDE